MYNAEKKKGAFHPWIRAAFGYGLAFAAVAFAAHGVNASWTALIQTGQSLHWRTITVTCALVLTHTLVNREAFIQLSKALDIQTAPHLLRKVWGKSLLAKYVPGGIWQIVGRAMLMSQIGIPRSQSIAVGLLEQAISLIICTTLALIALMALHGLVLLSLGALLTGIAVLFLGRKLIPQRNSAPAIRSALLYFGSMPFYLGAYASLATDVPLLDLTAQVFTGTVAGMLAFFVPGGLGVRESVATLLSSTSTPELLAALIIVRLATIAIETCISLISLITKMPHAPEAITESTPQRRVIVAGSALRGDGYPNASNTIDVLRSYNVSQISDFAHWLPDDFHLWQLARAPIHSKLIGACRLATGSLMSLVKALSAYRPSDIIYLPYPALPSLWLLSFIPRKWRPKIFCDAYITIWDNFYQDRHLGNPSSIISRILFNAESRALQAADNVIVDTVANAENLSTLFKVESGRIVSLPLALPPPVHLDVLTQPEDAKSIRILFAGTFVPLQGTTVIAQAIHSLRDRDNLEFILIGDGQLADESAPWLEKNPHVTWLRGWQPIHVIDRELARADICLGVFGGDGKAARVLPFKLYRALAAGKAIITQRMYSTPDGLPNLPALTCAATPQALSDTIQSLSSDQDLRMRLQSEARTYYDSHLSSTRLAAYWQTLLKNPPAY